MQSRDKEKSTLKMYYTWNHNTVQTHFTAAFHLCIEQSLDKDNILIFLIFFNIFLNIK